MTEPRNEPRVYNYSEAQEDLTVSNAEIQSLFGTHPTISASAVTSSRMVIPGPAGPIVTIHPDGTVELGPNATPDEAARAFWDAVQRHAPSPTVQQLGAPLAARIDAELAAGQRAQQQVQRLDQMATAWSERLPESISRDTVVEAIHHVTRPEAR